MVTIRRENRNTARHDVEYRDDYAMPERALRRDQAVSDEYLDYLWSELGRNERRKTLSYDEYNRGAGESERVSYRKPVYQERRDPERISERAYAGPRQGATRAVNPVKGRLDKKGVAAIVAYFLIVATIAALIIINGAGGATYDPATGSQAEVSVGAGTEINSTAELPLISESALGVMIGSDGSAVDISLLDQQAAAYAYQPETNWFDKLCDALSFVTGG
jgi:hypothetical protein